MKIEAANQTDVANFLKQEFRPMKDFQISEEARNQDMESYAELAKVLSDPVAMKHGAELLAEDLKHVFDNLQYVRTNGKIYKVVGTFSNALKAIASRYEFDSRLVVLNGPVDPKDFAEQVYARRLFRDVYTRPHGEFTHALQWLVLGRLYEKYKGAIAGLYSRSVKYLSTHQFSTGKGQERVVMWQFLVDCFEGNGENYTNNIICKTFRCPQYFTTHISEILPTESWLAAFITARRNKGLKQGALPYDDGHYRNQREVTMGSQYLQRQVSYEGSEDNGNAYKKVSTNVFEKNLMEVRWVQNPSEDQIAIAQNL
jgi:hypothetical protein